MPTLVPIGDADYITGTSPSLRVMQTIDERALTNLHAFARAFYDRFREPLVVTEGSRSRTRQKLLRTAYINYLNGGPWAALAAVLYTSIHDEINHGNALDLGNSIGTKASTRSVWARENGPRYGIRFTGVHFSPAEYWHVEVALSTTTASSGSTPIPNEEEDMDATQNQRLINVENKLNQLLGQRPTLELVRARGTAPVFFSTNRTERFWVKNEGILADYQFYLGSLGYDTAVKEVDSINSFGAVVGDVPTA